ncbi:MAG: MBL fold metallo-hydrolase [Prevotella sp.]|nr:MBL fold metallo-hydrolase [Prevotella sp.]
MKLTFLGTGTSCGVPSIGCDCPVCTSDDPHDTRLRTSALVETSSTRLLIDCGPDFRQQIMHMPFRKIDGIFITHSHYDHVGGIDDLRPYCRFGDIDIYADEISAASLRRTMPYCFAEKKYPGVPAINLHTIRPRIPLRIGDLDIMPFEVMHDRLPILGYRIADMAYITDMKTISDDDVTLIRGVDTLIENALRWQKPHHSHQLIDDAITFARRVGARQTWLIHGSHDIGLHRATNRLLPPDIQLAYDGQEIVL